MITKYKIKYYRGRYIGKRHRTRRGRVYSTRHGVSKMPYRKYIRRRYRKIK